MTKKVKAEVVEAVKAHAELGASNAKRWVNCSGSVTLSRKAPPPRESESAKEGTVGHDLMDTLLSTLPTKISRSSIESLKKKYGKEMFDHIFKMYEVVAKKIKTADELLVEEKISLDIVGPDMYGTVDCAIVEHFGTLEVIDLKYGFQVVEAKDNFQMIYYALGIAAKYDFNFSTVKLTIYQPRAYHADGPWRTWEISIAELRQWVGLFKKAVDRVERKTENYFPGEWCHYCPAAVICPEVAQKSLAQAKIDFDPKDDKKLNLPHPNDIPPEKIAILLRKVDGLEAWIKEVREYAFDFLNRGGSIEGHKLVAKRGRRVWADIDKASAEARKKFKDAAFTKPELLSPSQLEQIASKEWVSKYTVNVSSGLTLVREEDPRPKTNSASLDFNDDLTKELSHGRKKESGKKASKESNKKESSKKGREESYEEGSKKGDKKSGTKKESSEKSSTKKKSGSGSRSSRNDDGLGF